MSDEYTARYGLPLLRAGQAQKEMSHNEALTLLDVLVQGSVEAVGLDIPPEGPGLGQCWAVGGTPTGVWSGHRHAVAAWTDGGWRFAPATEGMTVWSIDDGAYARFSDGGWHIGELCGTVVRIDGDPVIGPRQSPIADPAGGATMDSEARSAIAAILTAMRTHGLIGS